MHYQTFAPPQDLRDLVRFWWTLESSASGSVPHRLMAETCPNIVVIRNGSFTEADGTLAPAVHLAGALTRATDNTAQGPFSLFGTYLWPWAVQALFQREANAVQDRFIAWGELLPGAARQEQWPTMHAEAWFNDVADVLRRLRTDGARDAELEEAVRSLAKDGAAVTVEELAMNCGLARRQFERRFKACTGFSPALFQRILRFQRTYRLLENGVARNLTDVALEAGYFDQSHFIRDFKRFGGMDPKQYFRHAPEKVDNFVRLP